MKKKEFLTENKKKAMLTEREKAIVESFSKNFNMIKRLGEDFDFADAERQYHDTHDIKPEFEYEYVVVIPYQDEKSLSVPSMNKEMLAYVGPNHSLVHTKQEAQVFSKADAENVKNMLTNKNAYLELA